MPNPKNIKEQDKEIRSLMIGKLSNHLEDTYAGDELLKALEWLGNYIMDLETEQELNTTLAIQEITHNEDE